MPIALAFVYFSPDGSVYNAERDDYFQLLERDIAQFKDDYCILICGDMNARCAELDDMCSNVEGSDSPVWYDGYINCNNEYWPPEFNRKRVAEEVTINTFGRCLIDVCKGSSLRICNGCLNGDPTGKCTAFESNGSNGKSVMACYDLALFDVKMSYLVESFEVGQRLPESDHCPILVNIKVKKMYNGVKMFGQPSCKYAFKPELVDNLASELEKPYCVDNLNLFYGNMPENNNGDMVCKAWHDMFDTAMKSTFEIVECRKPKFKLKWLDQECRSVREEIINVHTVQGKD